MSQQALLHGDLRITVTVADSRVSKEMTKAKLAIALPMIETSTGEVVDASNCEAR